MIGLPRKSSALLTLGFVLLLAGASSCRHRATDTSEAENTAETVSAVQQQSAGGVSPSSEAAGQAAEAVGYPSTPITPTRTASLMAQSDGAQINLRSQPTTQSESLGFGLSGEPVELLRLAEGEGGYSWYFLTMADAQTEGWIRGDFIDTSGETVATGEASEAAPLQADAEALPDDQGVCGRARPEAYFETESFNIHICNTGDGLRYVGLNKENQESLVTEDVTTSQGTYVAINGSYQYHINNNSLEMYEIHQGDYSQLAGETVIRHERFVY